MMEAHQYQRGIAAPARADCHRLPQGFGSQPAIGEFGQGVMQPDGEAARPRMNASRRKVAFE
jgi:hypothetical protein